ncbi:type 1 glutamine amidotransferase domain-containing protein [uncultured Aeromicrobium sp.]|uniref:type 1 glutamine amidotransferase domain-containing protein n=1 Tax=uncultured Aeromicrobium sp. TaxID=337820 RepID=UPI0025D22BEA|nr:type 1 glutamine amidotransferase domain-containing protein [uncultured Aeromicrobium sp.]
MTVEGKNIVVMTSQIGVEKIELTSPCDAIIAAGGTPVHAAPQRREVQSMVGDVDKDQVFTPDMTIEGIDVNQFDALVIPGGTVNSDNLRLDRRAVEVVREFAAAGKPIAAICHGPWALVEAGVVKGATLTSYPSLRTDITNAGGIWVDEQVSHDTSQGFDLITSRTPDDLDAFNATLVKVVGSR